MHIVSRIARGLARAVAVVALFVVALGASGWLHLRTEVGRQAFGDAVSGLVDREIPGTFRVEGVREVRSTRLRVDRIVARTEGSDEVLRLEDVTVAFDPSRSRTERAAIVRSATVGRGMVEIAQAPDGRTTVEQAFVRPSPPEPQPEEPGPYVMDLDGLRFEGVRVALRLGSTRARLTDARGRARIWLREGRDVQMRYADVDGQLTSSVEPFSRAQVRDFSLSFEPQPGGGPAVRFASDVETERSDLTVAGHAPRAGGRGVRLCVWTGGSALASALGIGAEIATRFTDGISFDMRPSRAPREPRCGEGA